MAINTSLEIASLISSFPDAFKSLPNEKVIYKNLTVSEFQGCEEFRKLIINLTKENYHLFSSEVLREIAKTNAQLYLFLKAKFLGHAFNLSGPIPFQKEYTFEGFNEAFTIPVICSNLYKFAEAHPELISKKSAEKIIHKLVHSIHSETVQDAEIDEIIKKITSGHSYEPFVVNAGYTGHLAPLVFEDRFIYSCNRGADSMMGSGITLLSLNSHCFTKEFTTSLLKRMTIQQSEYANLQDILKKKSSPILFPSSDQKKGTCTFTNIALTLVVLISLEKEISLSSAKSIYRVWKKFLRENLIKDFMEDYKFFKSTQDIQKPLRNLAEKLLNEKKLPLTQDLRDKMEDLTNIYPSFKTKTSRQFFVGAKFPPK